MIQYGDDELVVEELVNKDLDEEMSADSFNESEMVFEVKFDVLMIAEVVDE